MAKRLNFFNSKIELIFLLFIVCSNTAIVANWYLGLPEEVTFILKGEVKIPVRKHVISGNLGRMEYKNNDRVEFVGWAFDSRNSRPPDAILLWYRGKSLYWGVNNQKRPDLLSFFGENAINGGFEFILPLDLFESKEIDNSKIRFFAVSSGVASELNYFRGFK